jgi:hypothetical protein
MTRPAHSAARDAAYGRYYARNGATNAFTQAAEGGLTQKTDNVLRIAAWVNKRAKLPIEETLKSVPVGANVIPASFHFAPRAVLTLAAK